MFKMKVLIACLLLIPFGLIGCSSISISSTSEGIPGDQRIQVSTTPSTISTPFSSMGTVVGKLVSSPPGGSLAGISLYFGTILPLTPGPDHLVNMDIVNSPKALIDNNGHFLAENIPPGEYVLILWTPHVSRYIPDPDNTKSELIVKVVAGHIVDIGTVPAPSLP
jgi:hypothetical protein